MEIAGYSTERTLGIGGMAAVYLAEQTSLGREVALKVLSSSLVATDTTFCDRFIKEGKIIAKLHHPHIVTIHDIGVTPDGVYFMAMEYCSGGTLKERIRGGLAKEDLLGTIRDIALALGYAHKKGFVHRDIKPANVLFRDDGSAVLSDFGIAKTMEDCTQLTQAGWAIGTPEYMSPEQATAGKLTASSDLYSLGVVLYEMITGQKPYVADNPLSVAYQHINTPIPRLPTEYSRLQHLLDTLLAKQPELRYPDAEGLLADIDAIERLRPPEPEPNKTRVLGDGPLFPPPGDRETTRSLPVVRRSSRSIGALLGVALVVTLVLAWLLWRYVDLPVWQGATVKQGVEAEPKPPERPTSGVKRQRRVKKLLAIARAHEAVGRLRAPIGANAYEAYQLVLEIDPDNADAKRAIARLDTLTQ